MEQKLKWFGLKMSNDVPTSVCCFDCLLYPDDAWRIAAALTIEKSVVKSFCVGSPRGSMGVTFAFG